MGTVGICCRAVRTCPILARASILAQVARGLSVHPRHRVREIGFCFTGLNWHSYYIGWLCVGINSSILSYFVIAFISQWFLRTRYPRWFNKYNYIVAAALDGGTQVSGRSANNRGS